MIEFHNVSYKYKSGTLALENVNIEFPRRAISAVLGESGSGKTTMLMCLGQFLRPQHGSITYDGTNIYDLPENEFRRKVGIVFQKLYLFPHLTVLENLTLASVHVDHLSKTKAKKQAVAVLERLGILEIAENYPSQISGGQAQRAAIARGLLLKPDYMLLDEPTSALDANTTDDFAEWLKSLKNETNFVVVTHDILFAKKVASTGVYLSKGTILDAGDIENITRSVRAGQVIEA